MPEVIPLKVLLIEDSVMYVRLLRAMLESLEYYRFEIAHADRLSVALAHLAQQRYDLILSDLNLPDSEGLTTFYAVSEQAAEEPIVVLSSDEDEHMAMQAVQGGAQDYLVKSSVNASMLARSISYAVERQRMRIELQERNDELDSFSHMVAHDLKQPLNNLIGYSELLHDVLGSAADPLVTKCATGIKEMSFRMSKIIDGLLLLATVRKSELTRAPVDMHAVLGNALRRLESIIDEFQADVVLPDALPEVMGFDQGVEEVWANYLSNAIKYGGRPPRVEAGATAQPDGFVRFWVRDNGAGLTEEQCARLFTPFTRLSTVRVSGHGLGLSVVRDVVEKMGGVAGVESVMGRGSEFYFTLRSVTAEDRLVITTEESHVTA
jgi:signal transduction histidine kinase